MSGYESRDTATLQAASHKTGGARRGEANTKGMPCIQCHLFETYSDVVACAAKARNADICICLAWKFF